MHPESFYNFDLTVPDCVKSEIAREADWLRSKTKINYNECFGKRAEIVSYDEVEAIKHFVNAVYGIPNEAPDDVVRIEKVIFNNPATIVFWSDGEKTVVKCANEEFDKEKGLAMAICKRVFGNKGNYFNEFRKWITEEEEEA